MGSLRCCLGGHRRLGEPRTVAPTLPHAASLCLGEQTPLATTAPSISALPGSAAAARVAPCFQGQGSQPVPGV